MCGLGLGWWFRSSSILPKSCFHLHHWWSGTLKAEEVQGELLRSSSSTISWKSNEKKAVTFFFFLQVRRYSLFPSSCLSSVPFIPRLTVKFFPENKISWNILRVGILAYFNVSLPLVKARNSCFGGFFFLFLFWYNKKVKIWVAVINRE